MRTTLALSLILLAAAPAAAEPPEAPAANADPDDGPPEALLGAPEADGPAVGTPLEPAAAGLFVEFGRGATLKSPDGAFALTIRGRIQTRATARTGLTQTDPTDLLFQIRRARLVLLGDTPSEHLQLYIQLGFGASDLDEEREVPLRDAQVIWTAFRDASLRVGQMKVPFNRERMVSSSALQFADRSIVNAELNLDRDVGVQLFSNDLFGWSGRLAYQLAVYGGAGRNRTDPGTGLLYAARLQVQPLGPFNDHLTEADLSRSSRPRLSLGLSAGYHPEARRARTTHGVRFDGAPRATAHGALDLVFKWAGWSLAAEAVARRTDAAPPGAAPDPEAPPEAPPTAAQLGASGLGLMTAVGHVFASGLELAGRWAHLRGLPGENPAATSLLTQHALTACVGYYFSGHNLKLQTDYELGLAPNAPAALSWPRHEARIQLQLFF